MSINRYVQTLLNYAVKNNLIEKADTHWAANQIIAALGLDAFEPQVIKVPLPTYPSGILAEISAWAVKKGLIEDLAVERELLETKIIGALLARPSDFTAKFNEIKLSRSAQAATKWFYKKQAQADYIKAERVAKNLNWATQTPYGKMDITINLSKPEKDPKEIAMIKALGSKALASNTYPKCLLCAQNEGYAGRINFPARQNLRLVPLKLAGESWYFQYSPYVYYNEHCIVLSGKHSDMLINAKTFERLAQFLDFAPHYFIGSNADLPIVGGSILNHDHYQGGSYTFPMHKAAVRLNFKLKKWPRLKCAVLNWPLSVIRLTGAKKDVLGAAEHIFKTWVKYEDSAVNITPFTGKTRHNTVTPMAKMNGKDLQFDIALRNNATSQEFPDGIFHSRPQYHHIKRENIGLIEVMGMAILPGRLKAELKEVGDYLVKKQVEKIKGSPSASKHYLWAKELAGKHKFTSKNVEEIMQREVGLVFAKVLECCGVFKADAAGNSALERFIKKLNK